MALMVVCIVLVLVGLAAVVRLGRPGGRRLRDRGLLVIGRVALALVALPGFAMAVDILGRG